MLELSGLRDRQAGIDERINEKLDYIRDLLAGNIKPLPALEPIKSNVANLLLDEIEVLKLKVSKNIEAHSEGLEATEEQAVLEEFEEEEEEGEEPLTEPFEQEERDLQETQESEHNKDDQEDDEENELIGEDPLTEPFEEETSHKIAEIENGSSCKTQDGNMKSGVIEHEQSLTGNEAQKEKSLDENLTKSSLQEYQEEYVLEAPNENHKKNVGGDILSQEQQDEITTIDYLMDKLTKKIDLARIISEVPVDELVNGSGDELVDGPRDEPADEPMDEPVDEPVDRLGYGPGYEPVNELGDGPVNGPGDESVGESMGEAVDEPVDGPEDRREVGPEVGPVDQIKTTDIEEPSSPDTDPGVSCVPPLPPVAAGAPAAKGRTSYLCPLAPCPFSTGKEGMRDQSAALHLRQEHGIRHQDMAPGMYRFTKVRLLPTPS